MYTNTMCDPKRKGFKVRVYQNSKELELRKQRRRKKTWKELEMINGGWFEVSLKKWEK